MEEIITTSERIVLVQGIRNWAEDIIRVCDFDIHDLKYNNFKVDNNKIIDRVNKLISLVAKLEEDPIRISKE